MASSTMFWVFGVIRPGIGLQSPGHLANTLLIRLKLYKKFKFDHMNKWYMHNPESILENEMPKILWDFEIQMDHLISTRQQDHVIVDKKKRTCWIVEFAIPADHRIKLKENEKWDKYLDLARELKNCGIWKWLWYQL